MTAVREAAWSGVPVVKTGLKGLGFPKEIRNLIAEKRKLGRGWHQSENPHDGALLYRASQQLSKEVGTIKRSSVGRFLAELPRDGGTEYSIWKAAECLERPVA
jgi:hypothetical protein